jgi:hypothetical protein
MGVVEQQLRRRPNFTQSLNTCAQAVRNRGKIKVLWQALPDANPESGNIVLGRPGPAVSRIEPWFRLPGFA